MAEIEVSKVRTGGGPMKSPGLVLSPEASISSDSAVDVPVIQVINTLLCEDLCSFWWRTDNDGNTGDGNHQSLPPAPSHGPESSADNRKPSLVDRMAALSAAGR